MRNVKFIEYINRLPVVPYLCGLLLVASATGLTSLLWLVVERPFSAPMFLAAVGLSTYFFGIRVGIFASVISGVAVDYFFIAPYYAFEGARDELMRAGLFAVEGTLLSLLIRKLKVASYELNVSREELRELTKYQQNLREEEQRRISIEIHDVLGQALTGLKLEIHLIRRQLERSETLDGTKVLSSLEDLTAHVDDTVSSVRRIASEIRPSVLDDFGLAAAIEWQSMEFERKTGISCELLDRSDGTELSGDSANTVFRILQEALTNVTRHAGASHVFVNLTNESGKLALTVEDDGRGIDSDVMKKTRSLGIIGMRERARRIGGELTISPRETGGTKVQLVVPLSAHT